MKTMITILAIKLTTNTETTMKEIKYVHANTNDREFIRVFKTKITTII
jgi:hypothetical protein